MHPGGRKPMVYLGIILSGSLCVGMDTGNFCNCLACSNRPLRLWEYSWEAFPATDHRTEKRCLGEGGVVFMLLEEENVWAAVRNQPTHRIWKEDNCSWRRARCTAEGRAADKETKWTLSHTRPHMMDMVLHLTCSIVVSCSSFRFSV